MALALVAAIGVAWAVPAPVPALIARQDAVLLGRYSVGHLTALALGTVLLGLAVVLLWSRRSLAEALLLAALALGSTWAGVVAVASVARETIAPRYLAMPVARAVKDPALRARLVGNVTTREPSYRWQVRREDRPAPGRTYPHAAAGYPSREVVLTTDDRGLRNASHEGSYDVVVAGDSFTEGSMVSDEQTWWRRLADRSGLRIYNVGVSGLSLREYLNNWAAFGIDTGARTLIVTVYEGNDWKPLAPLPRATPAPPPGAVPPPAPARPSPGAAAWLRRLTRWHWRSSPLRWRAEQALIQLLAPIGADWPPPPSLGLSWMPVAVEGGGVTHHYAFEPKQLMRLDWDPAAFRAAPDWTSNEGVLRELVELSRVRGVRLVIAYAPVKPHVVLPLVRDAVSAEQLRAFAAFRDRDETLPPAPVLRDRLYAHLDTQERVLREWCAAEGVEFVSLTTPLRDAMARGIPVYFTYDQHWTEDGHVVVADALARSLGMP